MRYGRNSPYFIPPTFRFRLRQRVSPRLHQIVALSQITGYRFSDWMKFFGFDLASVFALQLELHHERTAMITPCDLIAAEDCASSNQVTNQPKMASRYVFAKVGTRDAVLYPRVVPGSIVRADRWCHPQDSAECPGDQRIWLVEHTAGLTCCYVKPIDSEHVILLPNFPPLSPWPLRLGREARILGLVDLEFRPRRASPSRPLDAVSIRESPLVPHAATSGTLAFSSLLRASRARAGLTLRAAHQMTLRVARLLGNREYGIALGLLSDYEALNKIPRHVAKLISLSAVYGIDPLELLRTAGIRVDDRAKASFGLSDAGTCVFVVEKKASSRPTLLSRFFQ